MDLIGTQFSLTLGSWKLRIGFSIEDTDLAEAPRMAHAHRPRFAREEEFTRNN